MNATLVIAIAFVSCICAASATHYCMCDASVNGKTWSQCMTSNAGGYQQPINKAACVYMTGPLLKWRCNQLLGGAVNEAYLDILLKKTAVAMAKTDSDPACLTADNHLSNPTKGCMNPATTLSPAMAAYHVLLSEVPRLTYPTIVNDVLVNCGMEMDDYDVKTCARHFNNCVPVETACMDAAVPCIIAIGHYCRPDVITDNINGVQGAWTNMCLNS